MVVKWLRVVEEIAHVDYNSECCNNRTMQRYHVQSVVRQQYIGYCRSYPNYHHASNTLSKLPAVLTSYLPKQPCNLSDDRLQKHNTFSQSDNSVPLDHTN
ncbi:unnamed protein product [Brugia timori]|uniref:Uncharacterized protein n=1 Tax=Brugia timori TaxID=42155 RepID=A0A3P7U3L1_9BILA|nr:unnamed protein product [Brugia timori]